MTSVQWLFTLIQVFCLMIFSTDLVLHLSKVHFVTISLPHSRYASQSRESRLWLLTYDGCRTINLRNCHFTNSIYICPDCFAFDCHTSPPKASPNYWTPTCHEQPSPLFPEYVFSDQWLSHCC